MVLRVHGRPHQRLHTRHETGHGLPHCQTKQLTHGRKGHAVAVRPGMLRGSDQVLRLRLPNIAHRVPLPGMHISDVHFQM